mgnify:CR=1 FL=1
MLSQIHFHFSRSYTGRRQSYDGKIQNFRSADHRREKLVGIITNRDLKFEEDFSKKIKESMTSEGLITAPEGITLEDAKKILQRQEKKNFRSWTKMEI